MTTDIVPVAPAAPPMLAAPEELTIDQLQARCDKVQEAIARVLIRGVDIIIIPGVKQPVATKSAAEKLALLFMFQPSFATREERDGDHRTYHVTCTLTHAPTGRVVGIGDGSCSTMESKYRWRNADRACPKCCAAAIIKGKVFDNADGSKSGGGWYCFPKKGGCGAKFSDTDAAITAQQTGRVENPDLADVWNTVLKMAQKRAFVGITLIATGASGHVTQDMEDHSPAQDDSPPPAQDMTPRAKPAAPYTPPPREEPRKVPPEADRVPVEIGDVRTTAGNTNGKAWTRYDVTLTGPQGTFAASTFSDSLGSDMQNAKGMRGVARLTPGAKPEYPARLHDMEPIATSDGTPF